MNILTWLPGSREMVLGCALDSFTRERIYGQKWNPGRESVINDKPGIVRYLGTIYWLQHSAHKEKKQKQSESVPANVTIKEEVARNRLKHIEEFY